MLMNERDELLLQKCVDDQLSPEETRALLNRLNSIEAGWQSLACGLMEDRSLRKALATSSTPSSSRPRGTPTITARPTANKSQTTRAVVRHWWSHPVTSLTLCAAIAFVGGMLIPDLRSGSAGTMSSVAALSPPAGSSSPVVSGNVVGQGAVGGGYRLQMQQGNSGVEIPVYDRLQELYQLDRDHPLFSELTNRQEKIRWMLVPVEDNKSMLIPVTEDTVSDMQ